MSQRTHEDIVIPARRKPLSQDDVKLMLYISSFLSLRWSQGEPWRSGWIFGALPNSITEQRHAHTRTQEALLPLLMIQLNDETNTLYCVKIAVVTGRKSGWMR